MSESLTKTNVSGQAQTMSSGRIPPCEGDHSFAPFTPSPVGWCPSAEKAIFLYLESVPLIHKVPPQKHPERCLATLTCSSSWSNVNTCPPVTSCPLIPHLPGPPNEAVWNGLLSHLSFSKAISLTCRFLSSSFESREPFQNKTEEHWPCMKSSLTSSPPSYTFLYLLSINSLRSGFPASTVSSLSPTEKKTPLDMHDTIKMIHHHFCLLQTI